MFHIYWRIRKGSGDFYAAVFYRPVKISGKDRMVFNADLGFGQRYEKIAMEMLGDGEIEAAPGDRAFSDWDFRHGTTGYEVKADRRAHSTGNLCFEYEHTGVPSGISISKADEWIVFVVRPGSAGGAGHTSYKIPLSRIRQVCAEPGTRKWHCDGGNSRFYLVPVSRFSEFLWT
jgi:hypothetical protein